MERDRLGPTPAARPGAGAAAAASAAARAVDEQGAARGDVRGRLGPVRGAGPRRSAAGRRTQARAYGLTRRAPDPRASRAPPPSPARSIGWTGSAARRSGCSAAAVRLGDPSVPRTDGREAGAIGSAGDRPELATSRVSRTDPLGDRHCHPLSADVKDLGLAAVGKQRILWADRDMPVLRAIRERFEKEKPLAGLRMSACLHVTAETANLARTLKAGGADLVLIASNPLSTQDDVAASLVQDFGIAVYAIQRRGQRHLLQAHRRRPRARAARHDGRRRRPRQRHDLHRPGPARRRPRRRSATGPRRSAPAERKALVGNVIGSMEETTTGVIRLRAMEKDGVLKFPVIAVNDAADQALLRQPLRHRPEHDRRHHPRHQHPARRPQGRRLRLRLVRQGRGAAGPRPGRAGHRHRGRPDPRPSRRRWTASRSCRWPRPPRSATSSSPSPATTHVIRGEHFAADEGRRDGLQQRPLRRRARPDRAGRSRPKRSTTDVRDVRRRVQAARTASALYVLGEGRLVNLAAAEGHPASVMDMSFATQALATEYCVKNKGKLDNTRPPRAQERRRVRRPPQARDHGHRDRHADRRAEKYLQSWEMGT